MDTIEHNLSVLRERIYDACRRSGREVSEIRLVAVTKEADQAAVGAAFSLGLREFGENRVQEAAVKIGGLGHLKAEIKWHMIGHLQSNKVAKAMGLFDMVQSVDSLKLARLMDRHAVATMPVLLEVDFTGLAGRTGFKADDLPSVHREISGLPGLSILGLMTVAPQVPDPRDARPFFRELRRLGRSLGLEHLSMGMTDDFEVAIEEGATIIRVGRAIFGRRRN
jgi:pyridoxal phosphate enzyme (YggS family)